MWEEAEKSIARLPGIHSCRIILDGADIDQVVVSATINGRDEETRLQNIKSLVRSITGLLALEYNLKLDYRKVKILEQDGNGEWVDHSSDRALRVKILASYMKFLNPPEVWVELEYDGRVEVGRCIIGRDKLESCFQAFRQAFNLLNLGQVDLVFITEAQVPMNRHPLIVAKVRYTDSYGESSELLGVVENRDDVLLGTVRACLDAVNRRLRS